MIKLLLSIYMLSFSLIFASDCVVINEIHYNPDIDQGQADSDYEFVELYNKCNDSVNISHWSLYKHDNCWGCYYEEIYQFESNVHIGANEYVVLAHNSNLYENSIDWGDEYLPNYGTELILVDSSCNGYNIKDYVHYDDQSPWPHEPDGHGPSLELVNPYADNNDPHSWQPSYVFGGTPNQENSNFNDEELCSELSYWECIENSNCEWMSSGWWGGDCVNNETDDNDESDENEDESDDEEDSPVAFIGFGNYSNGIVEVLIDSNTPLAGFQFGLEDLSLSSAFGGLAEENNFTVEYSSATNMVIGFSLQGNVLNPGTYILTNLQIDSMSGSGCIIDAIISDPAGEPIEVIYGDCLEFDNNVYGCTDLDACNYEVDATADNGTCEYALENFDCDLNCLVEIDCLGICGGDAVVDECGVCEGEGITDDTCDCDGNILDCAGECGGDAVVDECGVCDGEGLDFICEDGTLACDEEACNSFNGCDLPLNTLYLMGNEVLFNSSDNIGGFQFEVVGANILNAFGGSSEDAGFTISSSSSIVLGFSFEGSIIPAGCGTLLNFELDGESQTLDGIIVSDSVGNSINFTYFNGDENCPSGNYDCNGTCDGDAELDECGICDGLNECFGCTDSSALNYSPESTIDDGTCEYFNFTDMVIISEIHYNPGLSIQGSDAEYEFLELYNNSDITIDLFSWSLQTTNINYTFSENINLEPEAYLLLSRDSGVYDDAIFWGSERLENSSDFISLYDGANQLVDFVEYTDSEPWPAAADAEGSSLELIDLALSNEDPLNWQASFYIGGTPGLVNFIPVFGCVDENACNFDSNATIDNGNCEYPLDNFNCDGECLVDIDCEGVCGGDSQVDECGVCNGSGENCIEGCTDSFATNFNINANLDDESCFYAGGNYPYWDQNFDSVFDNFNNYEFSMSITSLVFSDDSSILVENDMLAAFVNDELRGVSQSLLVPTALGHELSFQLLIYSNLEFEDEVTFKYYSFENDLVYDLNESFPFNTDTFLGDVNNPLIFSYGIDPEYYTVSLDNTGNSALFIFTEDVSLDHGDEIGIFDLNGIMETSLECSAAIGETLVGSGVWQSQQLEIVAIESVDLCELGGFLLGGFQENNEIFIKVFSSLDQTEYYAVPTYTIGENNWGQPIYVINNLELIPEAEFFIELDPLLLNLISVNIASPNSELENMFGDDILLIFDDNSNFYIPNYDVNQIGDYNYAEGYMMFSIADEEVEMNMTGQPINHDHPVVLEPYKANMVPYFHQECLPVDYAFESMVNDLLLVKNDEGQYYIPGSNINTLNSICPGNAYIVFTNIDYEITFHYPQMIMNRTIINNENDVVNNELLLSYHNIYKTGLSMPIIIEGIEGDYSIGDHIVVYADNKKVGVEEITGEFPLTISAWKGFEHSSISLPGYNLGDVISIKMFDVSKSQYIPLNHNLDSDVFENQFLITGNLFDNSINNIPETFTVDSIYPNPFNPSTTITINVNNPGDYKLSIHNLRGQIIYSSEMYYEVSGQYAVSWDAGNYTSGIYIATISNNTNIISQKITLVK